MSLLDNRKAYLPLEEGKCYKAILISAQEYPAEEPTPDNLGFIAFKLHMEDGREITHTCRVPQGTDIFAQQLLVQLNDPTLNSSAQSDLFQIAMDKKVPLNMWVERRVVDTNFYTNYHFREFLPKPQPSATTTDEMPFK